MQRIPSCFPRRRLLALATLVFLTGGVSAQEVAGPGCPVGMIKCAPKPVDWSQCKKNDLLDFYVPGLPTTGDRSAVPADFSALTVQSGDKESYVLEGDAELRRLDQLLRADKLTYDNATTAWRAEGHVRYQDRGMLLSADQAHGRNDPQQCTLDNVRYQLLDSRGNGRAAVAIMDDPQHARLTQPTYTTCTLDAPSWSFQARDMTLDHEKNVGQAHHMRFLVKDVPIFWLPYATFPLKDERQSGFLFPSLGYSSNRGFDVTQPYYLNLAPNYDATLYPRLMTKRGLMLGAEFRYLTDSSRGVADFTYLPNDRVDKRDRGSLHWENTTRFNSNWGFVANVNHVSDDNYFEDFGRSLTVSATSLLPSRAYVSGRGSWWNASFGGDQYQVADPTLVSQSEPYRRLPRATFSGEHALVGNLQWGVDSEFVAFTKSDALDGQRLDVYPYLALPIDTAAYFIHPQLGYRYTGYDLDRDGASSPSRGVPILSVDSGLTFERGLKLGGNAWTQTLEPHAYYLRVPYRDQDDLPIFDTQEVPFSFAQLFRSNRFIGADRQMDANNLTLAVTSRLIEDASGDERVSASLGQIRYFGDQRVQLPGVPATDQSGSTWAGELDVRLDDRWRLTLSQQWDPNSSRHTELSAIGVQNRFGEHGLFNLSYRYRRDILEQVDASALIPLTSALSLVGRYNYSLFDRRVLESFVGFQHDSCCIAVRALARHWVRNTEGDYDTALYVELEFKGIGSIGQQTGDFLRRAILGYQ